MAAVFSKRRIEKASRLLLARRLMLAGARLTNVRTLTGISEKDSCELYAEIFGTRPSTGSVPNSPGYYVSTPLTQFHASAFYALYCEVRAKWPKDAVQGDVLLDAFEMYKQLAIKNHHDQSQMDIDRALVLVNCIASGTLLWRHCNCGGWFVGTAHSGNKCPICTSVKKSRCSSCDNTMYYCTITPKATVGRHSSLCETCKKAGYKPRRKSRQSNRGAVPEHVAALVDWGYVVEV